MDLVFKSSSPQMMWNEHPGDQVMRADKGKMTISGNLARKGREVKKKKRLQQADRV